MGKRDHGANIQGDKRKKKIIINFNMNIIIQVTFEEQSKRKENTF